MRKLAVLSVAVLALIATGAIPAHAGGPFCIHLTNFCDSLTITTDVTGNAYGTWDWTCDGVTLPSVLGKASDGVIFSATRPVDSSGVPFAYTTNFVFHKQNKNFDLWGTDGNSMIVFQLSQPYTNTAGACTASDVRSGRRVTDRQ